jgi:hypothetical protein
MPAKKELTIEYIDKKFKQVFDYLDGKFATKDDLGAFEDRMDKKFATKDDLKVALAEQSKELKDFAEEQTEHLARIISTTVAEPLEKHLQEVSMYEEVSMAIWKQISNKKKRA